MLRFYETPPNLIEEQDIFEQDIQEFSSGKIDPVKFKAIRVAHGVYEQRQNHTYMIRIRCAAGGITPQQLKKVAELGEKYGSGEVHFTTRQEVQVHDVLLQNVIKVIRGLNDVGLSSRGGGGNTVRNVLTSPDSGISKDEAFDVDPYAMALTTRMIAEPDSWNLPRKFKIAFSKNEDDDSFTQTTCLGFVATTQNGQKGFKVHCAGGMGAKPMIGHVLFDFVSADKVYHITKALKLMFDQHGNRRSKYSSRIKFLWKKLQDEDFKSYFHAEYDKIKDDDSLNLELPSLENMGNLDGITVEAPVDQAAFDLWVSRFVYDQKQPQLKSVKIPLRLGDLLKDDADVLCDFLSQIGDNTIRCDRAQNIRLRNIPETLLGNLFNLVSQMETLSKIPAFIGNMINCTGAQTCKLGICLPRGLSDAIRDRIVDSTLDLDAISDFRVNMSGCPNTCGMHHIADLGFFGKIGRKEGEIYPAYNVLAGAKIGKGTNEYAARVSEIPSKHVPEFVFEFLGQYIPAKKSGKFEDFRAYLDAEGRELIKGLCEKYKHVPELSEDDSYYKDWGAKRKLTLDDMGKAECSAGMFDMIDVDKKAIEFAKKILEEATDDGEIQAKVYKIIFHASRMLLVTRGLDGKNDEQIFELFRKHFIEAGLVDAKFNDVVVLAKLGVLAELVKHKDTVFELADAVNQLYKDMDDSLRFPQDRQAEEKAKSEEAPKHEFRDYRGVACPMNFVKTKLVLEGLPSGKRLEVLLDDGEPIENVPNSVKLEGHKVLEQKQTSDGHWSVMIEKA